MKNIKKSEQRNKGITLTALVITIIVLLILAGVAIATLTGENGILTKANEARIKTEETGIYEQVQVEVLGSIGADGKVNLDELNDNLRKNVSGLTYNGKSITAKFESSKLGDEEENRIQELPAIVTINETKIEIKENGKISRITTYTYYFKAPEDWKSESIHAHIWDSKSESQSNHIGTEWPGIQMQKIEDSIYKVEITPDENYYLTFDYIIFNDIAYDGESNTHQSVDIPVDREINNNKLYSISSYNGSETQMFFRAPYYYSKVYAYMWHTDESNNTIENAKWPGVEITNNKISADGYYVVADNKYTNIIFNNGNNGNGDKTLDLDIPKSQNMTYDSGNNSWSNYYALGTWSKYSPPEN